MKRTYKAMLIKNSQFVEVSKTSLKQLNKEISSLKEKGYFLLEMVESK